MVNTTKFQRDAEGSPFAKPNLNTSRRNFLAAASTVATAGVLLGAGLWSKPARAAASDQGCQSSGGQANGCTPTHHCFLSGTRIATPDREVAIDDLRIGDLVMTVSGEPKPIKWIGLNHYTRRPSQAWKPGILPVRVAQFALNDRTPCRDLYLSSGHAVYLHGLLIPVTNLVNGRTIAVVRPADVLTLDYYHIELEDHDVVIAEGTPAETFDGSNRSGFDNAEEYEALYGSSVDPKHSFAPLVSLNGGRQALRSRLRSAISPVYDIRQPLDVIRDHIHSRAFDIAA